MQVRRLSPTAFWIEMPLSAQTCLLVWQAMASSGLRQGKINSFTDEHFGPGYAWQAHLVEGRTAEGFLDEKAKVQAKLSVHEGGTLLEFDAANITHQPDFGAAWRVRRRLVPRIMQFIQDAPADWASAQEGVASVVPPLASPLGSSQPLAPPAPSFEPVVPIARFRLSSQEQLRLLALIPIFLLANWLHLLWLLCLLLAASEVWTTKKRRARFNWIGFLCLMAAGLWGLYGVIRVWL